MHTSEKNINFLFLDKFVFFCIIYFKRSNFRLFAWKPKVNQFFVGVYRSMLPSELLTANKKIMHIYESFCTPLCRKYQLNQSDLDLILFIANNPIYNTAKDVCEIRGIKKGIVSVTAERLVQSGYLIRKNDIHDRRIQRLCLTEKCQPIIADGREMQTHFFTSITAGLSDEELKLYQKLSEKIRDQVIKLEKEL